jgi:PKD repeat protein
MTTTATGLTVNFSASTSVGNVVSYAWDFGAGATGTGVTTSHTFSSFGAYPVTLIITDGCGQKDTLIQTITVCTGGLGTVSHSANGLIVNFSGPTDPGQFTSISWNFGDGATGSGASPSHTYAAGGTYSVIVTATDNCGNTYSQTLTVVICLKPTAYFTFRVLLSNGNGMTVEFDASATTDAVQYQWLWGDGSSGTGGPIINHTYPVAQLGYTVRLIALSSCGTSDTVFHSLRELGDLDPEFSETGSWFPNPIRSGASLSWLGTLGNEPMHIRLITADGRLLGAYPCYQGTWQVPVLAPGIYWLEWLEGDVRRRAPIAVLD